MAQDEFEDVPAEGEGTAAGVSALMETSFIVELEGFEGPLDLLLDLARRQKVDLHKISVLALVEQYLAFIEEARSLRLELAADYLVMAAWLAYLKSRLLLPQANENEEPVAEEVARLLAARLVRLEALRAAASELVGRPRLGRDTVLRGNPEKIEKVMTPQWETSLQELLEIYASRRARRPFPRKHEKGPSVVTLKQRTVWSLTQARAELERLIGAVADWSPLDAYLLHYCTTPEMRRTVRASSLSAMLEMAREGLVALRQDEPFAPLWVKSIAADKGKAS
ncbi:segregation and condensation protein A [Beijerinckia indica]|uniref:Segregation and condensation protein A n=1 Tax=Beijerinckia indica subsp. indica (strain ATCC 9039 / DSM 1715 / NCIMB 8712) TaxID=395963 RepID=B2IJG7_BEII9|nr:chromosome segregation and condensation protein ScpA [Beijerinckia indica subsp. indica ATCC 9039]